MNAILVQITAIEQHSIESSRTLTGFDLGDLHNLAAALEAAAKAIRGRSSLPFVRSADGRLAGRPASLFERRGRSMSHHCKPTQHLQTPVYVRALGDEVRALNDYVGRGLLTQEEAQERLAEWELFYPAGWHRITSLVDARQPKPLPKHERNVQPWDMAEAAE